MSTPRLQEWIHRLEVGAGARVIQYFMLTLLLVGLVFVYDLRSYRGFNSPEAMDVAQVARNLADGNGYSTDFIRPFSIYLVQQRNLAATAGTTTATNLPADPARLRSPHPDLANPPVYPTVLAGLMKVWPQNWAAETGKPFWSTNGRFIRYQPEFCIAILNQILLLVVVALTFMLAKKLFDLRVAWLSALLLLGTSQLWEFSVSGLSTILLLAIFLGLVWCLVKSEEWGQVAPSRVSAVVGLAVAAGLLTGLGMLTRYSFGWMIVPVGIFLFLFGGTHRKWLPIAAVLAFILVVTPWVVRNFAVSGTPFGTAGYALTENALFPGSQLMQSMDPNLAVSPGIKPYIRRILSNLNTILQGGLGQVGSVWLGILFFAGLMLSLRSVPARRLRYFLLMSLGGLIVAQVFATNSLSALTPVLNSDNFLILLAPLVAIFATVFFLTLLDQMKFPVPGVQYLVIALLFALAWQPLAASVWNRSNPVSYPPYYPPEIQNVAGMMKPDELMMSDVPWAVAWYGRHQCAWLTSNAQDDFYALNDYLKSVGGIYFTTVTMDGKFLSEMARGDEKSWGHLVLNIGMQNKFPPGFPLKHPRIVATGLFLTDPVTRPQALISGGGALQPVDDA